MDKYKVKINPRAIRELDSIYQYIANEKLAPENSKGQIDRIKKAYCNDTISRTKFISKYQMTGICHLVLFKIFPINQAFSVCDVYFFTPKIL